MSSELERLVRQDPKAAIDSPEALFYMLFSENITMDGFRSKVALASFVMPPIEIINSSYGSPDPPLVDPFLVTFITDPCAWTFLRKLATGASCTAVRCQSTI